MELRRRISLDNTQLDEVDTSVIITGIEEKAPQYSVNAIDRGTMLGQFVTYRKTQTMDINVEFVIALKAMTADEMTERMDVLAKVKAWAQKAVSGEWLRVNYRSGQKLRVYTVTAPSVADICDWSEPIQMVFRAFLPYWQSESDTTITYEMTNSQTIFAQPDCTLDVPCGIKVTNTGTGILNSISVTLGTQNMVFSGMKMSPPQSLILSYDDDGRQTAGIYDGTLNYLSDAMQYRSVDSVDDIILTAGVANKIVCTSDLTANWTISYSQRWD